MSAVDDAAFGVCYFLPFVGSEYAQAPERLLVLGESHYRPRVETVAAPQLTRRVVEDALLGRDHQPFLARVAHAINGAPIAPTDFWPQVGFYNFIQEFAGTGPRQRPAADAWLRSIPALRVVIEVLRPHLMLVCGRTLWERLKADPHLSSEPVMSAVDSRIRSRVFHGVGRWTAVGGMLYHPASFGFRPQDWYARIQQYRRRARSLLATGPDA